jgi:predicted DNA-binding antitoxin AbrB/MazE fold protein
MEEVIAVVENGQIKLPPGIQLPEGMKVRVAWDPEDAPIAAPYDRQALTEEDVRSDLTWATGRRFQP